MPSNIVSGLTQESLKAERESKGCLAQEASETKTMLSTEKALREAENCKLAEEKEARRRLEALLASERKREEEKVCARSLRTLHTCACNSSTQQLSLTRTASSLLWRVRIPKPTIYCTEQLRSWRIKPVCAKPCRQECASICKYTFAMGLYTTYNHVSFYV